MPVTGGKNPNDVSQREQYHKGGLGRWYWDFRDESFLGQIRGPRLLDLGCGEGITLEKARDRLPGALVLGCDLDPRNTRICREHSLEAIQGDTRTLPFAGDTFDTVLLIEVIEHLEQPIPALREIHRVLKPAGVLIVVYPIDVMMFLSRVVTLKFREAAFDPGHVRQWNRWTLRRHLRRTGFHRFRCRSLPWAWPCTLHGLMTAEKQESTR